MENENKELIIHLVNERNIALVKSNWFSLASLLKEMDNGNLNIMIDEYIIPKSSINYIELKERASEIAKNID